MAKYRLNQQVGESTIKAVHGNERVIHKDDLADAKRIAFLDGAEKGIEQWREKARVVAQMGRREYALKFAQETVIDLVENETPGLVPADVLDFAREVYAYLNEDIELEMSVDIAPVQVKEKAEIEKDLADRELKRTMAELRRRSPSFWP